jgi:PIN domain nuclease of toxin-antitoxin system
MGALLDTHALIWWLTGDERFSRELRQRLGHPEQDVFVSAATAWEIATKVRNGKLDVPQSLLRDFALAVEALGFLPLAISLRHGADAGRMRSSHRDPFDRILATQARVEGLDLVSCDPAFDALGVKTIW